MGGSHRRTSGRKRACGRRFRHRPAKVFSDELPRRPRCPARNPLRRGRAWLCRSRPGFVSGSVLGSMRFARICVPVLERGKLVHRPSSTREVTISRVRYDVGSARECLIEVSIWKFWAIPLTYGCALATYGFLAYGFWQYFESFRTEHPIIGWAIVVVLLSSTPIFAMAVGPSPRRILRDCARIQHSFGGSDFSLFTPRRWRAMELSKEGWAIERESAVDFSNQKRCGRCNHVVHSASQVGERCPNCGAAWGYESTTTSDG